MGLPAGLDRKKTREKVSGMFVIYLCIPLTANMKDLKF